MGIQVAQARLFVERFIVEVSLVSPQKMALGCQNSLPYVVVDDLPCPALRTINALRWLETAPGSATEWPSAGHRRHSEGVGGRCEG